MADIIDTANAFAARLNDDALDRARGKSEPESHPDFNGLNCVDCGDDILPARLLLNKVRCLDCQEVLESKKARGLG